MDIKKRALPVFLYPKNSRGFEDADLGFGVGDLSVHDVLHQVLQRNGVDVQELVGVQVLRDPS